MSNVTKKRMGNCEYTGKLDSSGKRHGEGFFEIVEGTSTGQKFEGTFIDDAMSRGKYMWPDGSFFDGTFVQGLRSGFGTYQWANGDSYVGMWKDDQKHGKGKVGCLS
jgi:hypothetical protein